MKFLTTALMAASTATAAVVGKADDTCCFGLTAVGGPGVGQLDDGQNRLGDARLPLGKYCLRPDGTVYDTAGRACLLTPPTTQWQCDAGGAPSSGFGLTCSGLLTHSGGDTEFWTCPTGDHDGWNIYSKKLPGEPRCKTVELQADSCYSGCVKTVTSTADCPTSSSTKCTSSTTSSKPCTTSSSSSKCTISTSSKPCTSSTSSITCTKSTTSSKPCTTSTSSKPCTSTTSSTTCKKSSTSSKCSSSTTSSKCSITSKTTSSKCTTSTTSSKCTTSTTSSKCTPSTSSTSSCNVPKESCPAYLGNSFEFPHLIVPVNKQYPHKAYGTQFNGTASPDLSSYFKFDVPPSAAGKMCTLEFILPKLEQLETSSFELSGNEFEVSYVEGEIDSGLTYANQPTSDSFYKGTWQPGNSYDLATRNCPAGRTLVFKLSAVGDSYITWFEDSNPCPIGLFLEVE